MNLEKEELIGMLLSAATYMRLLHWQTSSGFLHEKIAPLSLSLIGATDDLVEAIYVSEGPMQIDVPHTKINIEIPPEDYFFAVLEYVRKRRSIFTVNAELAILDEIEKILTNTLYIIKYLR